MRLLLRQELLNVLKALAPLVLVVCLLQFTIVRAPTPLFLQFLFGSVLAGAGMLLLFIGTDLGIVPMGRFIGGALPKKGSLALIIAVAFAVGFATTVAEPDVLVLANQVDEISQRKIPGTVVLYVIGAGLGAFAAIAMVRIIRGWSMKYMLIATYALALVLALLVPADFVSIAFDAGSVTTGVLSAPVIIALSVGLSSVLAGRSAVTDGFGILGFASIGAIIAVLLMALLRS
jgi:hypothetical protein